MKNKIKIKNQSDYIEHLEEQLDMVTEALGEIQESYNHHSAKEIARVTLEKLAGDE